MHGAHYEFTIPEQSARTKNPARTDEFCFEAVVGQARFADIDDWCGQLSPATMKAEPQPVSHGPVGSSAETRGQFQLTVAL